VTYEQGVKPRVESCKRPRAGSYAPRLVPPLYPNTPYALGVKPRVDGVEEKMLPEQNTPPEPKEPPGRNMPYEQKNPPERMTPSRKRSREDECDTPASELAPEEIARPYCVGGAAGYASETDQENDDEDDEEVYGMLFEEGEEGEEGEEPDPHGPAAGPRTTKGDGMEAPGADEEAALLSEVFPAGVTSNDVVEALNGTVASPAEGALISTSKGLEEASKGLEEALCAQEEAAMDEEADPYGLAYTEKLVADGSYGAIAAGLAYGLVETGTDAYKKLVSLTPDYPDEAGVARGLAAHSFIAAKREQQLDQRPLLLHICGDSWVMEPWDAVWDAWAAEQAAL